MYCSIWLPNEQLALLKRCCSALAPQGKLIFRVHDRERGLRSTHHHGFRPPFVLVRADGRRPLMLSAPQYQRVLENAGMQVEDRRFRNRLPLAHILFIAKKPFAEAAAMMVRFMRWVGHLVVDHPGLVTALTLVLTLLLVCEHPQPAHRHRPDRLVW